MDKTFMDFASEDFNINFFINELGDIDSMSSFDILENVRNLNTNDRRQVFANEKIRNKLRHGLLFESKDNQWYYYRKILEIITPSEFLSLYDSSYLTEYFIHTEHNEEKYKFYAALCEKDINDVVNYILKNKDLYENFFKNSDAFYSSFENLNYDLFREVILKKQEEGLNLGSYFLNSIKMEYQYDIINDPLINDDTLVFLLSSFSNIVKSYFFENDSRAFYLYTRFDINNLASKGVKFNDNILKKKDFFDSLKSDSFVEFRTNINSVEKYNNPIIIEDNLEKYYDEIIGLYQSESGLFSEYEDVLNNPGSKHNNSYIIDVDVSYKISHHLKQDENGIFYYEDMDELLMFLKNETSKKLSEVIIDALFRDNIYNVWLNIKEMLRYNNLLDDSDKVIDREKSNFYEMVLNFDKIDNGDKIDLYNKLKDKNFSMVFYSDLRKIKDVAYNRIKDNLINPSLHPEYIDKVTTAKYGVQIYDLRDKEYTMLVRTQADFREVDHYRRGCYSIISNENTQVFGEYDYSSFLYGYNSFENDRVLHMFESDSYSSNFRDEPSRYVNRIMTSEQLVKSSVGYSEVQLVNIKSDKKKYRWYAKKPDFIVAFNLVGDKHVKESKRLGIPIVVISRKKLTKDDVIDVDFDMNVDAYVKNIVGEREHKIRR